MEFSFDRSKESQTASPSPSSSPADSTIRPGPDLNTLDPSTIANERLRKAIERNRAKQAGRAQEKPAASFQAPPTPPERPEVHAQASFFTQAPRQESAAVEEEVAKEIPKESQSARGTTTVVSRRSVAKPDDTEFVPVKRTTRKVASQISYTTTSARKKPKQLDSKYAGYLVKGSWAFCGLMILRLIFAGGGITDYYSQRSSVNARVSELNEIKKENMQLVHEIEKMRSDIGFQKKLVRDNLGFIASDEFLVLFPKE